MSPKSILSRSSIAIFDVQINAPPVSSIFTFFLLIILTPNHVKLEKYLFSLSSAPCESDMGIVIVI